MWLLFRLIKALMFIKLPEPKHLNGSRNAKELENFLWDIEQESLKKLKQTGSAKEYVKEFSSLMLDIQNMSEEDKLFNFMSGVKDIPSAMAAAEGLVDFCISSSSPSVEKNKSVDGKKGKNKDWKKRANRKKKKESESTIGNEQNKNKSKTQGCFICNGSHRARDCPKKEKINALISQDVGDSDDAGPSQVNPLQLLNTILAEKQPSCCKGLMYVTAQVNGRDVWAMLDTGATNNFVARREVYRLGLNLLGNTS
ncbi:hypothetical protein ACOSQ4_027235 [Xanthoceras sorbifolium]